MEWNFNFRLPGKRLLLQGKMIRDYARLMKSSKYILHKICLWDFTRFASSLCLFLFSYFCRQANKQLLGKMHTDHAYLKKLLENPVLTRRGYGSSSYVPRKVCILNSPALNGWTVR